MNGAWTLHAPRRASPVLRGHLELRCPDCRAQAATVSCTPEMLDALRPLDLRCDACGEPLPVKP